MDASESPALSARRGLHDGGGRRRRRRALLRPVGPGVEGRSRPAAALGLSESARRRYDHAPPDPGRSRVQTVSRPPATRSRRPVYPSESQVRC